MAYITPNTTVIGFKGVPLDNSYEHTVIFASEAAQAAAFQALSNKRTFSNLTYQRAQDRQAIRVEAAPDTLLGYNYMMFKNTAFGSKWFYAFINQVNYINDDTTELVYEIDLMQTYLFDYTLGKCMIERQHSVTDVAGDNLLPEPVDTGPFICIDCDKPNWFDTYYGVLIAASRTLPNT